jgi:hypothetical protein
MSKSSQKILPVVVIACQVFESLLQKFLPPNIAEQTTFLDYGLHVVPKKLTTELQAVIDTVETPSLIILGYGLCGNGLKGIQARQHTLIIPKTDDCIAILLGSYAAYQEIFTTEPGTYYLTKGWLEAGSNPLAEYRGYVEKYGQSKADMVMDMQYQHYTRLMFVAHDPAEFDYYREQVAEIAQYCERWGMRYEERLGDDRYIQDLVDLVNLQQHQGTAALPNLLTDKFVFVPPAGEIEQNMFLHV